MELVIEGGFAHLRQAACFAGNSLLTFVTRFSFFGQLVRSAPAGYGPVVQDARQLPMERIAAFFIIVRWMRF